MVFAVVLALVAVELATRVEHIVTLLSNAVDVIDLLGEPALLEATVVVFHKLLESVLVQLFVLHVKVLVLLHVGLVLEDELTGAPIAVKVRGLLVSVRAVRSGTILTTAKPKN